MTDLDAPPYHPAHDEPPEYAPTGANARAARRSSAPPPHDTDAEEAVLGAMLISPDRLRWVVVPIAVVGAHMSGLPLNGQLLELDGRLQSAGKTAPVYRFYALPGGPPHRPGLVRVAEGGSAIELEVWSLPAERIGDLLRRIPAPLGLGTVSLADGTEVPGFLCEAHAAQGAKDITSLGGWRAYVATLS